jgi:hypothetical protein
MASGAYLSFGTLLKIGDGGGPENFTTVAEVKDISGPAITADVVEVTNMSSPSAFKEKLATLLEAGEITFDINWMPEAVTHGVAAGLMRDLLARNKRNFKLVFTNIGNTTWTIPCYVTSLSPAASVAGVLTQSVTLTPWSAPTIT